MTAPTSEESDNLWRRGVELEDQEKFEEAVEVYRVAANLGHALAQSNLGNLLDDKVQPARPKEAVYWYKRAIKSGNAVGAWNLAMRYRNAGNDRWGLYWLQKAARMGGDDARVVLGRMKTLVR